MKGQSVRRFAHRNKFGNVKTTIDNIVFDSKLEASRYLQLKLLDRAGEIRALEIHKRIPLMCGDKPILFTSKRYPKGRQAVYEADFDYIDVASGKRVTEDTKGQRTDYYKLKKAIMEAMGYTITEIPAKKPRKAERRKAVEA